MHKIKLHIAFLVLAFGLVAFKINYAQTKVAIAKIDSSKIVIGEQTIIKLKAVIDKSDKVTWPLLSDTINSKIDIVAKSKIDTLINPNSTQISLEQNLTITSFDSGYWAIPPFHFILNGDTSKILSTDALLLEVTTLPVDTTKTFKDIKAPLDAPITFKELLPYIIYSLIGIAIITALIIYFKKRKKKEIVVVEEIIPEIPAHEWALNELELLANEKLWQQGKTKLYHIKLADILRTYLEKRYSVYAMEQTTDEIVKTIRSVDITEEQKSKIKQVLFLSDMVKFAKEMPIANENEMSYQHVLAFVKETMLSTEIKS